MITNLPADPRLRMALAALLAQRGNGQQGQRFQMDDRLLRMLVPGGTAGSGLPADTVQPSVPQHNSMSQIPLLLSGSL